MREAEQWLVANAYHQKQRWQQPGGLHCKFLYQQMFSHATATGKSEHNHTICWGQRKPSPECDLRVEPTAMELIGPDSKCQDIVGLYQDVYQLQRLPGRSPCGEGTEEYICQEILDSIKERLQLKQLSALPEVEQKQMLA